MKKIIVLSLLGMSLVACKDRDDVGAIDDDVVDARKDQIEATSDAAKEAVNSDAKAQKEAINDQEKAAKDAVDPNK